MVVPPSPPVPVLVVAELLETAVPLLSVLVVAELLETVVPVLPVLVVDPPLPVVAELVEDGAPPAPPFPPSPVESGINTPPQPAASVVAMAMAPAIPIRLSVFMCSSRLIGRVPGLTTRARGVPSARPGGEKG